MARIGKKTAAEEDEMPVWRDLGWPVHNINRIASGDRAAKKPPRKNIEKGIPPGKKVK